MILRQRCLRACACFASSGPRRRLLHHHGLVSEAEAVAQRQRHCLVAVGPTAINTSLPQRRLPFVCLVLCLLSRPPVDTDRAKLFFFVDLGWFQFLLVYLRVMRPKLLCTPLWVLNANSQQHQRHPQTGERRTERCSSYREAEHLFALVPELSRPLPDIREGFTPV